MEEVDADVDARFDELASVQSRDCVAFFVESAFKFTCNQKSNSLYHSKFSGFIVSDCYSRRTGNTTCVYIYDIKVIKIYTLITT